MSDSRLRGAALACVLVSLCGCATISGKKQSVFINSVPNGAEVVDDSGHRLGRTPLLASLDRKRRSELTLKVDRTQKTVPIEGKYRWGRSFFGNFIFGAFAPAGWITDLSTGAAWELPEEEEADFSRDRSNKKVRTRAMEQHQIIAIAPPRAAHGDISDQVGHVLEERLKTAEARGDRVLGYDDSLAYFTAEGVDGTATPTDSQLDHVSSKLGNAVIFTSDVDTTSDPDNVRIAGSFHSPGEAERKSLNLQAPVEQVPAVSDVSWRGKATTLEKWLPNSVFIDLGKTRTGFTANDFSTQAVASPTDDVLGQVGQYLSAISLRQMIPPTQRDYWRWTFAWTPTSNISRAREKVEGFPGLYDVTFIRDHADFGWGPTIAYGSRSWSIYGGLYPLLGYNDISADVGGHLAHAQSLGLDVGVEIGALYYFRQRWVCRFYTRSSTVPTHVWEDVMSEAAKKPIHLDSTDLLSGGLAFGYIFSNRNLPF